jgi:hypothetical protein
MKVSRVRLAVAALLFLGWLGWLVYLVVNNHDPVILSRPQFLVADLWVIGDANDEDGRPGRKVTVRGVIWAAQGKKPAGEVIEVVDLPEIKAEKGWEGTGTYILPLTVHTAGKREYYTITPLPPSPAFPEPGDKRIYIATSETRAQLDHLLSEWNRARPSR